MSQTNLGEQAAQLVSLVFEQTTQFQKHKQELIGIIVDKKTTDDNKLDLLESNILEFQIRPEVSQKTPETSPKCPVTSDSSSKSSSICSLIQKSPSSFDLSQLGLQMGQSSLQNLQELTNLVEKVTEPSRLHAQLLESISQVLKNNDSSPVKIKAIRKLLL
jgi:hypothetical protein